MIDELLFVAHPGLRARAYLQMMLAAGLPPARALLLGDIDDGSDAEWGRPPHQAFDPALGVGELVRRIGLPHHQVASTDINSDEVVTAVRLLASRVAVFTGGGILRRNALRAGPQWIHVHPGRLPDFRGSTCLYYALLAEGHASASAFVMEAGLDTGNVLAVREFPPPEGLRPGDLDHAYDAWIRGVVLLDALRKLKDGKTPRGRPQDPSEGEAFHIIHPVLKHLAVLQTVDRDAVGGMAQSMQRATTTETVGAAQEGPTQPVTAASEPEEREGEVETCPS